MAKVIIQKLSLLVVLYFSASVFLYLHGQSPGFCADTDHTITSTADMSGLPTDTNSDTNPGCADFIFDLTQLASANCMSTLSFDLGQGAMGCSSGNIDIWVTSDCGSTSDYQDGSLIPPIPFDTNIDTEIRLTLCRPGNGSPVCIGNISVANCCPDMDQDGVCDVDDICPGGDDAVDSDVDGVPDFCDICPGGDDVVDSDVDGVPDFCDICSGGDDTVDSDVDGVPDFCDICPGGDDAVDSDVDGVPDFCDICPGGDDVVDSDVDGVPDFCDICPGGDDAVDSDVDGVPDFCDICPGGDDAVDSDVDGVPDFCDICPGGDDVVDSDVDGVPDFCDICPGGDDTVDSDVDGVPDFCDVCPGFDDTMDADADGVPDDCDVCPVDNPDDTDGDGVCDSADICPGGDDMMDSDSDGIPDFCDVCDGNMDVFCDCATDPPVFTNCPMDFTVNIMGEAQCDTTLFWPAILATDDCEIEDFNGYFLIDPIGTDNWLEDQNGPGNGTNASFDYSNIPSSFSITGTNDGVMGDNTNADLCITIPADGTLVFDWSTLITGGGAQLTNDEPAYTLNGTETILATGVNSTAMGTDEMVPVMNGQQFCFRVKSNNQFGLNTTVFSNFQFNQVTVVQTDGPMADSSEGAGDGTKVTAGTYNIVYTATDGNGNEDQCSFTVTVKDKVPTLTCADDITLNIISNPDCDTTVYWDPPIVMDNCVANGFEGVLAPTNWDFSIISDAMGDGTQIDGVAGDTSFMANSLEILGTDGSAGSDTVVTCVTVPINGNLSFDWMANMTSNGVNTGGGQFDNDDAGYFELNGVKTKLTIDGMDSASGSVSVPVNAGDSFCFYVASNGGTTWYTRFTIDNILFINNDPVQISGPISDSTPGAGDGQKLSPGVYPVKYEYTDNGGQTADCVFHITIKEQTDNGPSVDFCPTSQMLVIQEGPGCDTTAYWAMPEFDDNCDVYDFEKGFAPNLWTLGASGPGGGSGTVDVSGAPASIVLSGSNDGTPGSNTITDLCIEVPGDGSFSFDWDANMYNGVDMAGGKFNNDEPAYTINGSQTILADGNINMANGSESIDVTKGDVFCFRVRSMNNNYYTQLAISNFVYKNTVVTQTAGPAPDSSPGAGDGEPFGLGIHNIEYTATDANGNTETCSFTVTVMEEVAPILTCPEDFTLSITRNTGCDTTVFWNEPLVSDNCEHPGDFLGMFAQEFWSLSYNGPGGGTDGFVSLSNLPADITIGGTQNGNAGSNTNTNFCIDVQTGGSLTFDWYAEAPGGILMNDEFGFKVSGQPQVLLAGGDNESQAGDANVPLVKGDQFCFRVKSNNQFAVTTAVISNLQYETVTVMQTDGINNNTVQVPGEYPVEYIATDGSGNSSTCGFTVTVKDVAPPIINCPDDLTFNLRAGKCKKRVNFDVTATDNCGGPLNIVQTDNSGLSSGDKFPTGVTTLEFETEDLAGNVSTCSFDVIVNEHEPEQLGCKNINLSVDQFCEGFVTIDMILTGDPIGCAENFEITLTDHYGNPVLQPITSEYLWQTLNYHVSNPFINFACWGTVTVEDKFAPIIQCRDITLSCTEMFMYNGPTVIFDNCSDYRIEVIDQGATPITDCDSDDIKVLHKAYRAIDEFGNVSNECIENITIEKVDINLVTFPDDSLVLNGTALSCSGDYPRDENDHPSPAYTGEPMLDGIGLWSNNPALCDLVVYYEDTEIPSSGCVDKIMRMWFVRQWFCDREYVQPWAQQIEIADTEGPSLTLPADLTVNTNPGVCTASVFIPAADVMDICHEPVEVDLFFENGFRDDFKGGVIPLPEGVNTLKFIAYDQCWNSSEKEMTVTVKDQIQPTMLCELYSVVSLSTGETVRVYAESYDAGTSDNCELDYFEVRRMFDVCDVPENLEFGPYVEFCCADIGTDVMVQLRAYDKSGNYNECMVMVEVQDKIPPILVAPPNITVSCNFDFVMTDLASTFGQVVNGSENVGIINIDDPSANFEGLPQDGYVEDNCSFPVVANMDDSNINNCGQGYILRSFSVGQGTAMQTVEQRIDIINPQPFNGDDESDLDWPEDYTTENVCDSSALAPELLPPGFAEPLITEDECDLVGPTFSDEFYDIVPGEAACFKILRTWTVIDWCQRNSDGTFKTWTHIQTLKVSNTDPPSITSSCDPILVESFDGECGDVEVNLKATATDICTPADEMFWKYDIDIDSDGDYEISGNSDDASGFYEVGVHTIRWIAEDKCGNESEPCFRTFELVNLKAPTAKCLDSLTTRLVPIDVDAAEVTVNAEFFNAGSDHVCEFDVNVSFSSDENDIQKTFTCEDAGFNEIELWATDINGNQSFCIITVEVLDAEDADVCGLGGDGDLVAEISGQIFSEVGESLESVDVHLAGSELDDIKTGIDGFYAFPDMPQVGNYEVIPNKYDSPLNGVSTLDLVLMQRHILGLETLGSVYKMLAADVNISHSITASDMVELRKVILGVTEAMPDGKSWRFVDADHQFTSSTEPWTEAIPASYPIVGLSQDMEVDFIGYKVGDVSGNAQANFGSDPNVEVRSGSGFSFLLDNMILEKGQIYEIQFKAGEANKIFGMQWVLDISSIEVLDVYAHSMKLGFEHMGIISDQLRVSWSKAEGLTTRVDDVLFSMVIRAKKDGLLLDQLSLLEDRFRNEIYLGENLAIEPITLRQDISIYPEFTMYQNEPNPWNGETSIRFELPRSGVVDFSVFDYNGKQVHHKSEYLDAGDHIMSVSNFELNQSGIYFYELGFEGFVQRKKMILIK